MTEQASLSERRQFPRYSRLSSGMLLSGDKEIDCQVIDMSIGGAQVRPVGTIDDEDNLAFQFNRFGNFISEVVWRTSDAIGLRFTEPPEEISERLNGYLPSAFQVH